MTCATVISSNRKNDEMANQMRRNQMRRNQMRRNQMRRPGRMHSAIRLEKETEKESRDCCADLGLCNRLDQSVQTFVVLAHTHTHTQVFLALSLDCRLTSCSISGSSGIAATSVCNASVLNHCTPFSPPKHNGHGIAASGTKKNAEIL